MNIKDVKVTARMVTSWDGAKSLALATSGKRMVNLPDDKWKRKMLMCEHAPIRYVQYDVTIENLPYFVSVHLVRHKIGVEHFVTTQRDDRTDNDTPRAEKPQGAPVSHRMLINAHALISISHLRLCSCASAETRAVWNKVKEAIEAIDPIMAEFMVPSCVRLGFCKEFNGCGFTSTSTFERQRMAYQRLISNGGTR